MAPPRITRTPGQPATDKLARALLKSERMHRDDLGPGPRVSARVAAPHRMVREPDAYLTRVAPSDSEPHPAHQTDANAQLRLKMGPQLLTKA